MIFAIASNRIKAGIHQRKRRFDAGVGTDGSVGFFIVLVLYKACMASQSNRRIFGESESPAIYSFILLIVNMINNISPA